MTAIALRATASYLPESVVPVADLPELAALSPRERETCLGLGVDTVAVADGLSAVDLAERAGRKVLAEVGLSPTDVDALIVVESRAPGMLLASEATDLQRRLGADRAATFSVGGLGCVSITPALLTARGLLAAQPEMSHILLVHGSKPATHRRYRHPVTVSGDGGQAVLVARDGPIRILDVQLVTNGDYWDLFRVDYRDRPTTEWREECASIATYSFKLAVETRNRLRDLHARILDRSGMRREDIACYLSQNLSVGTFRVYEELLDMKITDSCFENLRRYGHLGPIDVLLNVYRAVERDELPDGAHAVAVNVSPSAAWSAFLVQRGSRSATHRL